MVLAAKINGLYHIRDYPQDTPDNYQIFILLSASQAPVEVPLSLIC